LSIDRDAVCKWACGASGADARQFECDARIARGVHEQEAPRLAAVSAVGKHATATRQLEARHAVAFLAASRVGLQVLACDAAAHLDGQELHSLHQQGGVRRDAALRQDVHVEALGGRAFDEGDALRQ
jgi:hypothetical protein